MSRAQHDMAPPGSAEARDLGARERVAGARDGTSFPPAAAGDKETLAHLDARGVITRALRDALALCPPLIITEAELETRFERVQGALHDTLEALVGAGHRPG